MRVQTDRYPSDNEDGGSRAPLERRPTMTPAEDEALSLELLADLEDDRDNKAKAKRLRARARKIREQAKATR